ncbi:MAG: ASPIC/UnbV domain-containing protein [Akkermansiaceae bacterium]
MSQSPSDAKSIEEAVDPESPFRRNLKRLNNLIDSGSSFSGYERNCAFLNLGGGKQFATVSSITGFDFADDARAIGLCDWDRDGDIDAWVQNRTAPMLRFLRNDLPTENRSLQIRLQGTKSNRDAIGARVEITTNSGNTFTNTLKAGEGFLSQRSKWMHFGLGTNESLKTLTIRWPGGEREQFVGATTSDRFLVIEGSGKAIAVPRNAPPDELPLTKGSLTELEKSSASRSALATRFPLPPIRYRTFDGRETQVVIGNGQPVLINVWASWCAPCAVELKSFANQKPDFDKAGLEVIALSVDGLTGNSGTGSVEAKVFVQNLNLPFAPGMADMETLRRIEFIHNLPSGLAENLPVPASLLVDGSGGLAAVYRGTVEVETILQDLANLNLQGESLLSWPLPFPEHRWLGPPLPQGYFAIPIDLIEQGHLADATNYLNRNRELLRKRDQKRLSFIHGRLGIRYEDAGKLKECVSEFESALSIDPTNVEVSNNLAWQLAAGKDASMRDGPRSLKLADFAARATGFKHPAVLDTLAAALAQSGRYREAIEIAQKGAEIARKSGQEDLLKSLNKGIEDYQKQQPRSETKD